MRLTRNGLRRGFTLIELLVVIAIIAILAAILFPVFAQAKTAAKKASDLTQKKQLGTAVQIYLADYDDTFPLALTAVPNDPLGWSWGFASETPADWDPSIPAAIRTANTTFWANSIFPYIKNRELYRGVGAPEVAPSWSNANLAAGRAGNLVTTTVTMNGLLMGSSATSINAVSQTIVFWDGKGYRATRGYGYTNPYLICNNANAPCVYQPNPTGTCSLGSASNGIGSNMEMTGLGGTRVTGLSFGNGQNFVFADSSAKFRTMGGSANGGGIQRDPWTAYTGAGFNTPNQAWYENTNRCHPYQFRPDWDGSTTLTPTAGPSKI